MSKVIRTSKDLASPSPSLSSPLLALAPELRNNIYRFALTDTEVTISDESMKNRAALLSTCKQIRSEAWGIFYNECKFRIIIDGSEARVRRAVALVRTASGRGKLAARMSIEVDLGEANVVAVEEQATRLHSGRRGTGRLNSYLHAISSVACSQASKVLEPLLGALTIPVKEGWWPCGCTTAARDELEDDVRPYAERAYVDAIADRLQMTLQKAS